MSAHQSGAPPFRGQMDLDPVCQASLEHVKAGAQPGKHCERPFAAGRGGSPARKRGARNNLEHIDIVMDRAVKSTRARNCCSAATRGTDEVRMPSSWGVPKGSRSTGGVRRVQADRQRLRWVGEAPRPRVLSVRSAYIKTCSTLEPLTSHLLETGRRRPGWTFCTLSYGRLCLLRAVSDTAVMPATV